MSELSIDQVAKRTGIRASALRYYERERLIPVAARAGGRRVYGEAILDRLAVIRLAQGAGLTVAETRTLLDGIGRRRPASQSWRRVAAAKLDELEDRLAHISRMKQLLQTLIECPCPTLEDCGRVLNPTSAASWLDPPRRSLPPRLRNRLSRGRPRTR